MSLDNIEARLRAEFPRDAVKWRAQTVTRDGGKALALAYIDARDAMDRLDEVVGSQGWQCEYYTINGTVVCKVGLCFDGVWIWKSDGAGETQVEAEKGALSDAFKRACVRWGIARYLYGMGDTWVPCESIERNGKQVFRRFTEDPWNYAGGVTAPPAPQPSRPPQAPSRPAQRQDPQAAQPQQGGRLMSDKQRGFLFKLAQEKAGNDGHTAMEELMRHHKPMSMSLAKSIIDHLMANDTSDLGPFMPPPGQDDPPPLTDEDLPI